MRLPKDFYRLSAPEMAPALLGKYLCVRAGDRVLRRMITETECYYGRDDSACHAARGMTDRNRVMFEEGGVAYVYLCYGLHHMLNVVSGHKGHPEAVLIRGIEGYDGPGKLTRFMGITRELNGENLMDSSRLRLEDGPTPSKVETLPRVGIDYAAPRDRDRLWRFVAKDFC